MAFDRSNYLGRMAMKIKKAREGGRKIVPPC